MNRRIAVSVGHNPNQPGFKVGTISEYSEMNVLAGLVVQKLQMTCNKGYLVGTGRLEEKVASINRIAPDCAIELHLNAGGGHGYETLYCPGSVRGKSLAASVNSSMDLVLNSRNRGVKEGWYKMDQANGPDYFLAETSCPATIFEMYFLDNQEERAKYIGSLNILDAVAERIVFGLLNPLTEA